MTTPSGETSSLSVGAVPSPTITYPSRASLPGGPDHEPTNPGTGGSGTLGRSVVDRLLAADHQVRGLSRRPRPAGTPTAIDWVTGELISGHGLAAAVADVAVIVHCASNPFDPGRHRRHPQPGRGRASGRDLAPGRHLHRRVDRVPYRYYQAKLQAERLIQASGLPWTILRAIQFHQLVLLVAEHLARLPLVPVPAASSFQPIDAAEVADRLTALAIGPPAGRVPDMGGPQIRIAADLVRTYLRMAGRRRPLLPVHLPGPVFAGYRQGGHLDPDHAVGHRTWEEYLAGHVGHRWRAPASWMTAGGKT